MRNIVIALTLAFALVSPTFGRGHGYSSGGGSHRYSSSGRESHSVEHVHGYVRKDGTYVRPHDRTKPNGTQYDNWSTKGNVNPETGKPGTVTPTH